jgi:hypothetical protein
MGSTIAYSRLLEKKAKDFERKHGPDHYWGHIRWSRPSRGWLQGSCMNRKANVEARVIPFCCDAMNVQVGSGRAERPRRCRSYRNAQRILRT